MSIPSLDNISNNTSGNTSGNTSSHTSSNTSRKLAATTQTINEFCLCHRSQSMPFLCTMSRRLSGHLPTQAQMFLLSLITVHLRSHANASRVQHGSFDFRSQLRNPKSLLSLTSRSERRFGILHKLCKKIPARLLMRCPNGKLTEKSEKMQQKQQMRETRVKQDTLANRLEQLLVRVDTSPSNLRQFYALTEYSRSLIELVRVVYLLSRFLRCGTRTTP
ncbi:hypothetical protein BDZ45DRAFT_352232 [Acephala macrosclerotiorum]|nr:hypothetical protein BDZ45DRAFT_352232 [Acephala macrosclerotiorum]